MSRIGNKPIEMPAGIDVKVEGNTVTVSGKGITLSQTIDSRIGVKMDGNVMHITRANEEKETKSMHGLYRALIHNMVEGIDKGFSKELEINGVGYRAAKQGNELVMNLGYSHQVVVPEIPGITIEVPAPNKVIVKGADKQAVGQFAAEIREKRPPSLIRARASNMSTRLSSARKVKPARVNKEGGVSEWLQKLIARRTVLKDAPEYAAKCTVLPSVPDWPFSAPPTTFMLRSSMMILA